MPAAGTTGDIGERQDDTGEDRAAEETPTSASCPEIADCTRRLVLAEAAKEQALVDTRQSQEKLERLAQEQRAASGSTEESQRSYDELKQQFEHTKRQVEDLLVEKARLAEGKTNAENLHRALMADFEELARERKGGEAAASPNSSEKVRKLETDIANLESQKDVLERQLDAAQAEARRIEARFNELGASKEQNIEGVRAELMQRITTAQQEIDELIRSKQQIEVKRERDVKSLQRAMADLEGEKRRLEEALALSTSQREDAVKVRN